MADKNESGAIAEYTNALRSNGSDMAIKSSSYMALADLYFKRQDYENAQVYYDSAARTVDPANPNYQSIQDKNLVLNELIKHLINIKEKDSLLRLAEDKNLREKTIDKLIRQARDKAETEKQDQEIKKLRMDNMNQMNQGGNVANANFPFYNQAARNKGLQDFQRIWGARERNDFWAISSNKSVVWKKIDDEMKIGDKGSTDKEELLKNTPDERKPYYDNIPFTIVEKQKMKDDIAESYFLGANVYYQNLKEHEKAKKMLEDLNFRFPGNKYQINSWYLLARIYREQKNEPKAEMYIELIRKTDPKSNFLNVLLNTTGTDSSSVNAQQADDQVEQLYAKAFNAFKAKNYDETLLLKRQNDSLYPGNPLQVNFDYLEALVSGEKNQLKEFQAKLQAIVDNYPDSEIGKQSAQTIQLIKVKTGEASAAPASSKYNYNASADHFYILLVPKSVDFTQLKIAYLNYNKSFYPDEGLRVTNSLLGDEYQILIVNNLKSLEFAKTYISKLQADTKFFSQISITDPQQFLISKDNFSILITDKVLSDYLSFYKTNYTF
jgi:tetratricopeptide (TPR) repeat protein